MIRGYDDEPDLVDIRVEIKLQTDRAWLVCDGDIEVWVPKSIGQVDNPRSVTRYVNLTIPVWFAEREGLV